MTQTLPNALQPIPVTNRTDPANYLTHIMLLNCWLCSAAEVKERFIFHLTLKDITALVSPSLIQSVALFLSWVNATLYHCKQDLWKLQNLCFLQQPALLSHRKPEREVHVMERKLFKMEMFYLTFNSWVFVLRLYKIETNSQVWSKHLMTCTNHFGWKRTLRSLGPTII